MPSLKQISAAVILFLSFLMIGLGFTNCSGNLGGITVDNPLSDDRGDAQYLRLGFKPHKIDKVSARMCIDKLVIRVNEFYNGYEMIPNQVNIVGTVRDLTNQQIGELRAIPGRDNFVASVFTWFEDEFREVELSNSESTMVFELDIIPGDYTDFSFVALADGCESLNNHSLAIENDFGAFGSNERFRLFEPIQLIISEENHGATINLDTSEFVEGLIAIDGSDALDNYLLQYAF